MACRLLATLVLSLALAALAHASVDVKCAPTGGKWKGRSGEVVQYQCNIVPASSNKGPLCVKLQCSAFSKSACSGQSDDCAWNVEGDCSSPNPVWPGSTWNFGFQTTKGKPAVALASFAPPVHGVC